MRWQGICIKVISQQTGALLQPCRGLPHQIVKTKTLLITGLIIAVLGMVPTFVVTQIHGGRQAGGESARLEGADVMAPAIAQIPPAQTVAVPLTLQNPAPPNPAPTRATSAFQPKEPIGDSQVGVVRDAQSAGSSEAAVADPVARQALALVGADPGAEAYWYGAINDPAIPSQERQDLIEDLNEDGLSNPKHPDASDLPVILRRIDLLQEIGANAMDQVNADAFQEAYKDLVNLADVAIGGGQPVR